MIFTMLIVIAAAVAVWSVLVVGVVLYLDSRSKTKALAALTLSYGKLLAEIGKRRFSPPPL